MSCRLGGAWFRTRFSYVRLHLLQLHIHSLSLSCLLACLPAAGQVPACFLSVSLSLSLELRHLSAATHLHYVGLLGGAIYSIITLGALGKLTVVQVWRHQNQTTTVFLLHRSAAPECSSHSPWPQAPGSPQLRPYLELHG